MNPVKVLASCYVCEGPVDITHIDRDLTDEECIVCDVCVNRQALLSISPASMSTH
jgi:hypothetical protein